MSGSTAIVGIKISALGVSETQQAFDKVGKRAEGFAAVVNRGSKTLAKWSDTSSLNRTAQAMQGLGDHTLGFARSIERAAGGMTTITSAATIGGLALLTRNWAQAGNQINKTAYALNAPVDKLSAFEGAAKLAGSSSDAMDSSLKGLGETLSGAHWGRDPAAISTLNTLNIGFHGANGQARQAVDALGDVADAISSMPDARTQIRTLNQLGISEDMLPLLKNGRKGLEAFTKQAKQTGGVMTAEMAANATKMNSAWEGFSLTIDGVKNRLVNDYSKAVTQTLDAGSHWIQQNQDLADSITKIGLGITSLTLLKPAAWVLRLLGLGSLSAPAAIAAGAAAGAVGAYQTGSTIAKAGQLGFRPSGMDEYGNPTGYVNPKSGETLDVFEMQKRAESVASDAKPPGGAAAEQPMPRAAAPFPAYPGGAPRAGRGAPQLPGLPPASGPRIEGNTQLNSEIEKQDFIRRVTPLAEAASRQTGVDSRIIVAQAGLETGWGKHAPGNNYFGIKGPGGSFQTQEFINGKMVTVPQQFAGYKSLEESFQGYADFINKNPRYRGLKSGTSLEEQVAALGRSGYATDPNYASKIASIAHGLPAAAAEPGAAANHAGIWPEGENPLLDPRLARILRIPSPASAAAPDVPAQGSTATGAVHVTVDLKGAGQGTTAKAEASGIATASPPRIERAMAFVG